MSDLQYTVTDLPSVWPGKPTVNRKRAPFKTQWTRTMSILARELRYLGARKVEIALAIRMGDLRQDGQLRADARPGPAVIVSFLDRDGQRQAYPCDTFAWWQDNLYAIAIVLEDLRRAERYGVQPALLRAGFKALPAAGQSTPTMDVQTASFILSNYAPTLTPDDLRRNKDAVTTAVRHARARVHPDVNGGDSAAWDVAETARRVLEAHHNNGASHAKANV